MSWRAHHWCSGTSQTWSSGGPGCAPSPRSGPRSPASLGVLMRPVMFKNKDPTCWIVDAPHLGGGGGTCPDEIQVNSSLVKGSKVNRIFFSMSPNAQCSPVILVCCAHHLAAWREVTDKWTWLASPSSSIQYSVPVKWLTRRLRGRHPAQVAATVEAWLLEIGVLHTQPS